ncbi:MAG: DUF3276 family protein [Saprospiraceae bacterium]|nr:DUF3276 family protein [Saprospiraceae bacterium]MBK8449888.1 DUF3276 family protein [Saprospiraceae bacterium]MBK8484054.1 DUF3276 family protein [Saprospiraceae bacterium]MBK9221457.1 DUF3276 family protein [Saprospiraceae bacterium]MBK9721605.1 DUF3276 family protein [Saprospiraceae bacterium]
MENEKHIENIFSKKLRAGKRRTYFFDIRKTKSEDFFISITESTRKFNGDGYERHKIFIYKEDFNRFIENLQEVVDQIKTNYLPDFDYDAFAKRDEEWENLKEEEKSKEDPIAW